MSNVINLKGLKFTNLLVLSKASGLFADGARWNCLCDCGNKTVVASQKLRKGLTKSCGCLRNKILAESRVSHGLSRREAPTYRAWKQMKQRCQNTNCHAWKNYGGRGIQVCERWDNFYNFFTDMGARPNGMSLDRINNDGDYSPNNCRWATPSEQNLNKRNSIPNKLLELIRQEKITAKEAIGFGISRTHYYRIKRKSTG